MIVVDSSALVAILLRESDHIQFATAIADAKELLIAAPNALEFSMVAIGKFGDEGGLMAEALIAQTEISIVPFDAQQVSFAVAAFLRFGRGRNHPARLNFGDCVAYALAKSLDAPLLFKGNDFSCTDVKCAI